jgi:hypothetical protein
VGDFVWPGFGSEIVVVDRVLNALGPRFAGFEPGPVEMIDDPEAAAGRGPRVQLPYEGLELSELWTTTLVEAHGERSTIALERTCRTCATEYWRVQGVEHWASRFDREHGELVRRKVPREGDAGILVREADLDGADIFRVRQTPGWVFCTDRVRDLVLKRRFTNVDFLEMGTLIRST